MHFTEIFIRRPVMASALSIFIVLFGIFGLFKLPLRLFPKVNAPIIQIMTTFPGASAQLMNNFVTSRIEKALTGIENVNYITASSSQSSSTIEVHMEIGQDPDVALTNVMEMVASVRKNLPPGVDDPQISKNQDDNALVILGFTSSTMKPEVLGDYLTRSVQPQLQAVNGVAKSQVWTNKMAMRVWIDPDRLANLKMTPTDVQTALVQQNILAAPGNTKGKNVNFAIDANTDLNTPEQFNNVVIKQQSDAIVRLKDVGHAELGADNDTISTYLNGKPAVFVFVNELPGANPLKVAKDVIKLVPKIQKMLPKDIQTQVVWDITKFINASIHEVIKAIFTATLIVLIVIFLFVGNIRAVIIPVVTIPLSLIGVCFFMNVLDFSLNTLTLLAMVLAIGLVVDDAIVMLENIFRHVEQGMSPFQAAIQGAMEVAYPVIAMTITLIAVYAPIGFSTGLTGTLFAEFAFTLASSVLLSGIIAITLSPMMCSKLLNHHTGEGTIAQLSNRVFNSLYQAYDKALMILLTRFQKPVLVGWVVILLSLLYFYHSVPSELAPLEDQGYLRVFSMAPGFTNANFVAKNSVKLNEAFKQVPGVEQYVYLNGVPGEHNVLSFAILKPWEQRSQTAMALLPILQKGVNQIPGLQSFVQIDSPLPNANSESLSFVLTTLGDYAELNKLTNELLVKARASGLFLNIRGDLNYDVPHLQITVNRQLAAQLGIPISDIANALTLMLGGNQIQQFSMFGRSYDVIMQTPDYYRENPTSLNKFQLRAQNGEMVSLGNLVSMKTSVEPETYNQFQNFNAATIAGGMAPGHSLSEGLHFLQTTTEQLGNGGVSYDFAGESRQFLRESHQLAWIFIMAILTIYLVLAIQFESYRSPLIILTGSVPLAMWGGLLFLKLGFMTLNIYTQIGLLTLIGLISKHGILMTQFANQLRLQQKMEATRAIIDAAKLRLRPILMTTAAMIFGALPLLLAHGAGAQSRFAIGLIIVTGMLIGTPLTLFVLPVIYVKLAKQEQRSES
jgi:multidrug efflux pump